MSPNANRNGLAAIRPLELAGYLRARGWQEVRSVPGKGTVWTAGTNGDLYEILLPLNPDLADYHIRLYQALQTLALSEGRSSDEVWEDVTTSGADIVRAIVQRPDAEDGSLPLEAGVALVDHTRSLLLAAACAAVRPRPSFSGRKPDRALEYLNRLRLGQTRRGSYVLTILAPVPQGLVSSGGGELFADLEEPFERRATSTLARALTAVQRAAERAAATGRLDAFQQAVSEGVSANLCEALVGMAGTTDRLTALQLDFSWSPMRPPRETLPNRVRLPVDSLPLIREAGRILHETSPQEEFVLRGLVVRLDRPEGAARGRATVLGFVEGQPRRVLLELDEPTYDLAIRAHQERQPISCTGELLREGRSLVLRHPRGFTLEPLETLFD